MVQTLWLIRDPSEKEQVSSYQLYSPLFLQLLAQRGLKSSEEIEDFLSPSREKLANPFLMKGMKEAVARIEKARSQGEKVLVHGDYDVDGVTGSAIVSLALDKLGVVHETFLPERNRDGYGVSEAAIKKAGQEGVRLLITVDCGISAREEIEKARLRGIDAIVLDHHQLPSEGLPPACAILNPLQEDCNYPFKELSAGGLAFKLAEALLGTEAFEYFDLATLSTVADMAPLKGENRSIVTEGLEQLSRRKRIGIKALSQTAKIRSPEIKTSHVGFMLGPRINASGRMSSALTALRLLLTPNEREALSLAEILEVENRKRREEERKVANEAVCQVERTINFSRDRVIVVAQEGWHAGVIGIVAARLVERYHRPALVIALQGGLGKGSGRSIRSFHLFNALEASRECLIEFGGHEQAAGFNILAEQIPALKKKLNEYSESNYPADIFLKSIDIDMEINLSDLTPPFLKELEMLEPFGIGNPKPVFLTKSLSVKNVLRRARRNYSKPHVWVTDGCLTYEMTIGERVDTPLDFEPGSRLDLVYCVARKTWEGEERIILEARDAKAPS